MFSCHSTPFSYCSSSQPVQVPIFTLNHRFFNYSPRNVNRKWVLSPVGKIFRSKCWQQEKNGEVFSSHFDSTDTDKDAGIGSSPSSSFLSVLCPLLKLFSGGDPSKERNYILEETTSSLSTLARLPWGSKSLFDGSQTADSVNPPILLQLFEFDFLQRVYLWNILLALDMVGKNIFEEIRLNEICTEACPFCRRVREALTELDLPVEVFPCPKGSVRHRELVRRFGGKEQFPFLIDPNTGIQLYESSDIVKYLFQQYGKGREPSTGLLESTLVTGWMPTLLRAGRGMTLWEKSRKEEPTRKLELFSYENNPYARLVREALCELELPYILHNVAEGSARAPLLLSISGSKEVPFLVDPNTGQQIGDHKRIISYLFQTYSMANA